MTSVEMVIKEPITLQVAMAAKRNISRVTSTMMVMAACTD